MQLGARLAMAEGGDDIQLVTAISNNAATSAAVLNTGITAFSGMEAEIVLKTTSANDATVFRDSTWDCTNSMRIRIQGGNWKCSPVNLRGEYRGKSVSPNTWMTLICGNNGTSYYAYVDGTRYTTIDFAGYFTNQTITTSMHTTTANTSTKYTTANALSFKSIKIKNNATSSYVRDFVPCIKKSLGEYGFFDLVEEKFYPSATKELGGLWTLCTVGGV